MKLKRCCEPGAVSGLRPCFFFSEVGWGYPGLKSVPLVVYMVVVVTDMKDGCDTR